MIKAGKYTAALVLILIGGLLLLDLTIGTDFLGQVYRFWPVGLIALGVEYLIFSSIFRDPSQKVGLAFGSLALAALLSAGVIVYTQADSINLDFGSIQITDANSDRHEMETIKAPYGESIRKVKLSNPNGAVKLVAGDVSELEIAPTLYVPKSQKNRTDQFLKDSRVVVKEKGNTLELMVETKKYKAFGINQKPRMDLVVTIPRDREKDFDVDMINGKFEADGIPVASELKVDTTNGAIAISRVDGSVIADTTNGAITIRDIQGDVKADTTNGSINVFGVQGNAVADTTNGAITLENIAGKAAADTTNGSVKITNAGSDVVADTTNGPVTVSSNKIGGNWKLDTTNGSITVHLPEDASFQVIGETRPGGKITTEFPLQISSGKVTGSVNGGQHTIRIDTTSSVGIHKH